LLYGSAARVDRLLTNRFDRPFGIGSSIAGLMGLPWVQEGFVTPFSGATDLRFSHITAPRAVILLTFAFAPSGNAVSPTGTGL